MDNHPLFTRLAHSFGDLRKDLGSPGKSSISTIHNYQFAIVTYLPQEELKMRRLLKNMCRELEKTGWSVLSIDLLRVLMQRLRKIHPQFTERLIKREKRFSKRDLNRGLNEIQRAFSEHLDGPEGIARDCAQLIEEYMTEESGRIGHTVIFIGRAGALYPFFRTSALLRYLHTEMTRKAPVVLLYPGTRHGKAGLSFMDRLNPDSDYRPRIY